MTKEPKNNVPTGKALIKQIGDALPVELQAKFYEEMMYLESLPECDEMLRIIRVLSYLALFTEQVPSRILTEREHFERICKKAIDTAKRLETTGGRYYQELHKHLAQLPENIATGISPAAIVERINDSLKKQFDMSTIPIISKELAANAERIKATTREYKIASDELVGTCNSATEKANKAIERIDATVSKAAKTAKEASEALSRSFNRSYYWILAIFGISGLAAGIVIGILVSDHNSDAEVKTAVQPSKQQPTNPSPKKK
jgi:methyl-accepting chemotaxis protein